MTIRGRLGTALAAMGVAAALAVASAGPATALPAPAPPPEPSPTSTAAPKPKPTAKPTVPLPRKVASPRRLSVPALGIDTKIYQVGLDRRKNVVIPEDIRRVGWYRLGVPPGVDRGNAVIVGHRDSATQGSGALFGIEGIPLGSTITVTDQDGTPHEFIVDSVELIDKSLLPAEAPRIFARTGDYRLVLITCGGAFDEAARSYLSNVVITALPAPAISQ